MNLTAKLNTGIKVTFYQNSNVNLKVENQPSILLTLDIDNVMFPVENERSPKQQLEEFKAYNRLNLVVKQMKEMADNLAKIHNQDGPVWIHAVHYLGQSVYNLDGYSSSASTNNVKEYSL